MAKDPAFLFYASDFLTGTMFMTNEQVGLYIRLLCAQHQHGGRIDTNVLRTQCDSITGGALVYAKFQHDERGSFNERLEEEMLKRAEKSVKARESVKKRWDKTGEQTNYDSNTNVLRSENENEDVSVIVVENEEKVTAIAKVETREVSKGKPSTIDEVQEYFTELGHPTEAGKFFDYFSSNGWKVGGKAPMKDWKAAVRNWCRNLPAAKQNGQDRKVFGTTTVGDINAQIERLKKIDEQRQ